MKKHSVIFAAVLMLLVNILATTVAVAAEIFHVKITNKTGNTINIINVGTGEYAKFYVASKAGPTKDGHSIYLGASNPSDDTPSLPDRLSGNTDSGDQFVSTPAYIQFSIKEDTSAVLTIIFDPHLCVSFNEDGTQTGGHLGTGLYSPGGTDKYPIYSKGKKYYFDLTDVMKPTWTEDGDCYYNFTVRKLKDNS